MASVIFSLVAVAVSSIFGGLAVVGWCVLAVRRRRFILKAPPFWLLIVAYCAAVIAAVVFSLDPAFSLKYLTRLLRFLLPIWLFTFLGRRQIVWVFHALIFVTVASALWGIIQYLWILDVSLINRIRGFMSHWMTFSGQVMILLVCLAALLLSGFPEGWERTLRYRMTLRTLISRFQYKPVPYLFGLIACLILGCALILTFTRNAWIGAFMGLLCLVLLVNWRWFLIAPLGLLLLFLVLPNQFTDRFYRGFDLSDTTSLGRLELVETGVAMVAANPITGVGPRMVPKLAPQYASRYEKDANFPDWLYQHLHNSPIQVAAETGLLGLVTWLGLWGFLLCVFLRRFLVGELDPFQGFAVLNGICVLIAFLCAGLFEYNFGDSEIVTLVLFSVTAPYVVTKSHTQSS